MIVKESGISGKKNSKDEIGVEKDNVYVGLSLMYTEGQIGQTK